MIHKVEGLIGGKVLTIETGRVARQADAAVTVQLGDTVVLATAVAAKEETPDQDFFPLTVDYREKAYAAGKIPGGFFKREGRPSEKEILTARLIDRPLRPLFPEGFFKEVQIMVTVLSSDQENDSDVLGVIGASAALYISDIPFTRPIGAVRVGRLNRQLILNPSFTELESSDLNLVLAGTKDNVVMVEGGGQEVSEADMLAALHFGHEAARLIIDLQEQLRTQWGKEKTQVSPPQYAPALIEKVEQLATEGIRQSNQIIDKQQRQQVLDQLTKKITAQLVESFPESEKEIGQILWNIEKREVRALILEQKKRVDGRSFDQIRPITCEVGYLPRTHGSALFTRGQTQALAVVTLGSKIDEQRIDDLEGESTKSYMLHYNFPPFSVGEVRPVRGPGRREIGHGALAERALQPVIPKEELFPYTIRIVSDILESNGSSSMATVCGGSLALMDAGVPIKAPVAGVAMGLVIDQHRYAVLTDIQGVEDHLGDMDFKVTGTRQGITGFQMDVKVSGITMQIVDEALRQARTARLFILDVMDKTIDRPRENLSAYAPRIIIFKIRPDKIGDVIGPGGKTIRGIIDQTGAKIDIEDDGSVFIASVDQKAGEKARDLVLALVEEAEVGKVYTGRVKRVTPFGAFVEIIPGQDGLVHISEMDTKRIARVEDIMNVGDQVTVKVIGIDDEGKIRLSRKALLQPDQSPKAPEEYRPVSRRPLSQRR